MVSQSLYLCVEPTLGLLTWIISCWKVAAWKSQSCFCRVPPLIRGRVCSLQCNHSIAVSRAEPVTILYCLIWDSPNQHVGPVISPDTGFPLPCLLWLSKLRWGYSNPPPTWRARTPYIYIYIHIYIPQEQDGPVQSQKSKSHYNRRSVNQYVLVPSPHGFRRACIERILIWH
jgi:hypothetical protein